MDQNKFTFESQNWIVDWISFNVEGLINFKPIARYFFEILNFNSTTVPNHSKKGNYFFYDKRNKY